MIILAESLTKLNCWNLLTVSRKPNPPPSNTCWYFSKRFPAVKLASRLRSPSKPVNRLRKRFLFKKIFRSPFASLSFLVRFQTQSVSRARLRWTCVPSWCPRRVIRIRPCVCPRLRVGLSKENPASSGIPKKKSSRWWLKSVIKSGRGFALSLLKSWGKILSQRGGKKKETKRNEKKFQRAAGGCS